MIVSKLSPSRFLKSAGTSIHSKRFNCFLRTAKRGLLSRQYSTVVFWGDPAVDKSFRSFVEFTYLGPLETSTTLVLHDAIAEQIADLGEQGFDLYDAVRGVYFGLRSREIVRPIPQLD